MATSPQANLPVKRSDRQLLETLVSPQKSTGVLPPTIVTANGEALPAQLGTSFRVLQNCGTVPVKYLVSSDTGVNCSSEVFHGILAPGVAQDDGKGGAINFDRVSHRISIFVDSGTPRVATFVGINPDYIAPAP